MRTELKVLRVRQNLTQREMAARLGITTANYCLIENGRSGGSRSTWDKLKRAFGLSASELIRLKEDL